MQPRLLKSLLAAAILVAATGATRSSEPANLGPHKDEIRAYVKSGEYDRDIAAVAARARAWLEERAKPGSAKLAVVFDLDETLLSNWPEFDREDMGFERTAFVAWWNSAKCPAIEPVREIYRLARRLGVEVIYLTGRPERFRAVTEQNLRAIDCADYAMLICKPDAWKETAAVYKTAQRKRLTEEGHMIIANLGDQESDLAGGYAERTFKLPDPFYLTP